MIIQYGIKSQHLIGFIFNKKLENWKIGQVYALKLQIRENCKVLALLIRSTIAFNKCLSF